jgi:DNA-binding winged helix-turn-helix (wHTH) protein/tetratricopeptide (TPR) repeat protein
MAADQHFAFASFRFDPRTGQLWRGDSEMRLRPRAAAVLHMLVQRAQDIVTKQELFDRVWGGRAVSDDALTSCIQEVRGALGDDARRPQLIETRHRRGYRLIVPAASVSDRGDCGAPVLAAERSRLVGRASELEELARSFHRAQSARRQVVFVSGEPGIGKSSLADAFVEQLRSARHARIAHGQCLDHHGVGEPYLPLIEALTRLAGAEDGAAIKDVLLTHAPSWLAQMPSLWTRSDRNLLEARGHATRERMMRELTLAIEAIAIDKPLALKLEDIHWSDASTLDWLAHVARRPEPARLIVLATFRPADPATAKAGLSDLVTELLMHGHCSEIALAPLGLHDLEIYLKARLGDGSGAQQLQQMAPLLLERTGGNPLFMTSIVNQLAQQQSSARSPGIIGSIPHDVRRFIDRQIDDLNENDRTLLTAASVIRREFATAAVAAALESNIDEVETFCARLARQGVFIVAAGSTAWSDGTHVELYAFRHDLYRELLYDRLPARRRALCHARVGGRLEAAWSSGLDVIASELAEHFERGNEPIRAIPHHQRAADKALRRSANEEAIGHLRRALSAVERITDEDERARLEVGLRIRLGAAFMTMRGFGASEVAEAYSTIEQLCERLGESADIFPALWGQWMFRAGRAEVREAWRICERLLALAEKSGDARLKLQAHHAAWATKFWTGKPTDTRAHVQAGLALYDAQLHQAMASSYGNHDASACGHAFLALAMAFTGDDEGAQAMAESAITFATSLNDPFSLAQALHFGAVTAQVLGDIAVAMQRAEAGRQLAIDYDLALAGAWCSGVVGWCNAAKGETGRGIGLLIEAIDTLKAVQSRIFMCYLLGLLAESYLMAGHYAEAIEAAENGLALADASGDVSYSAELHRLRGEALARRPQDRHKAQSEFRIAIKLARQQDAAALERRAKASSQYWSAKEH